MNISGLGSASWYTSLSTISTQTAGTANVSSVSDAASISQAGFAALLQEQGSGPPAISDDMAAKIGDALQQQDPDLFSALDSDGNGTLSADEFSAAMDALHGSQGPPPGPPPEMTDEQAATIGENLQTSDADLFSALDSDGNGTLSADELTTAMDSLHQAMDAGGMQPPPPPGGTSDPGSTGDLLARLLGTSSTDGSSDYQANMLNELLQSLFGSTSA